MTINGRTFGLKRISRLELIVSDIEASCSFYQDTLGFAVTSKAQDGAVMELGGRWIKLILAAAEARPYPETRAANDPWFQHFAIRVPDMAWAYARLSQYGHQPISVGGPQLLPPSTGSVTAYKFRDPDGHPLELSFNPDASGFGGVATVDHTALAVRDLDASIAFYTQTLGFSLVQRLRNRGPEQDRLDGLTDVDLDIAVLTTPLDGPHVELLHYRSPLSEATYIPMREGDIAATRTVLDVDPGNTNAATRLADPGGHLFEAAPRQPSGRSAPD